MSPKMSSWPTRVKPLTISQLPEICLMSTFRKIITVFSILSCFTCLTFCHLITGYSSLETALEFGVDEPGRDKSKFLIYKDIEADRTTIEILNYSTAL